MKQIFSYGPKNCLRQGPSVNVLCVFKNLQTGAILNGGQPICSYRVHYWRRLSTLLVSFLDFHFVLYRQEKRSSVDAGSDSTNSKFPEFSKDPKNTANVKFHYKVLC